MSGISERLFGEELDIHFPLWTGSARAKQRREDWVNNTRVFLSGMDSKQHHVTNHIVRVDGTRATVDKHMHARYVYVPRDVQSIAGWCTHSLRLVGARWLITAVTLDVRWDEGDRELFAHSFERGLKLEAQAGA